MASGYDNTDKKDVDVEKVWLQTRRKWPFLAAFGIFYNYNVVFRFWNVRWSWKGIVPSLFSKKVIYYYFSAVWWGCWARLLQWPRLVCHVKVWRSSVMLWTSKEQQFCLFSWWVGKSSFLILSLQSYKSWMIFWWPPCPCIRLQADQITTPDWRKGTCMNLWTLRFQPRKFWNKKWNGACGVWYSITLMIFKKETAVIVEPDGINLRKCLWWSHWKQSGKPSTPKHGLL